VFDDRAVNLRFCNTLHDRDYVIPSMLVTLRGNRLLHESDITLASGKLSRPIWVFGVVLAVATKLCLCVQRSQRDGKTGKQELII
jgi:hypothetical protein